MARALGCPAGHTGLPDQAAGLGLEPSALATFGGVNLHTRDVCLSQYFKK